MQKVEKKQRRFRMSRGGWIVLAVILLCGSVAAVLLLRQTPEEPAEAGYQPISGAISLRDPEEVLSITVKRRGEEPWTVIRSETGDLRMEDGTGLVDEQLGDMLADAMANLTYEDVFTEEPKEYAEHLADFGLEDPLVQATAVFRDGKRIAVNVGDSADPEGNSVYYMTVEGDGRLFALNSGTVQDLNVERSLLHPVSQPVIHSALLDRITLCGADGNIEKEWRLRGKVTDQDAAENWIVSVPFVYPADWEIMKNLRENAASLRMGVWQSAATEEALRTYGLDMPRGTLEFHLAAGSTGTVSELGVYDVQDWEERTVTLILGGQKGDTLDYVRYEDEIFSVNHLFLSVFTDTDPLSTVARYPVQTPFNSLESMTVAGPEGEDTYTILRFDGDDASNPSGVTYGNGTYEQLSASENRNGGSGSSADGNTASDSAGTETQNRCMKNGEEISCSSFEAAYERLLTVTVSGRLPQGYLPGPVHTTYTFRTVSGSTHTVELSDYDGFHDAVSMDGHMLFYLIKGGMTALP